VSGGVNEKRLQLFQNLVKENSGKFQENSDDDETLN